MSAAPTVLEVNGLTRRFGGLLAVNDVSFAVREGEIFGLIGPNGAGKTTLFNLITGLIPPSSGRLVYRGHDITRRPPHVIARSGIGRTFQNIRLFGALSALRNVMIGQHIHTRSNLLSGVFGLPGAFTPTCSAQHVPSYIEHYDELKAKGVDEIWCLAVNDAFVMGAWGREQKAAGKVRMMADGSADYTRKLGLELDLTARGMGVRCQRFAMVVDNGVVKSLAIEAPGKFEVSSAQAVLKTL